MQTPETDSTSPSTTETANQNQQDSKQPETGSEAPATTPPAPEPAKTPKPKAPAAAATGATGSTATVTPPAPPAPEPAKEIVYEDKTFEHSLDSSEKLEMTADKLKTHYVVEKYLVIEQVKGSKSRQPEKMTGAIVPVHKEGFNDFVKAIKTLGNIEFKVLHKPA